MGHVELAPIILMHLGAPTPLSTIVECLAISYLEQVWIFLGVMENHSYFSCPFMYAMVYDHVSYM